MDWNNWIVIEKLIEEPYWDDIIKGRLATNGFYNIKNLQKEGKGMQEYFDLLVMLEHEMKDIQDINVVEKVDARVNEYRDIVTQEEQTKKDSAIADKQAEIDAVKRIIARLQAKAEEETEKTEE